MLSSILVFAVPIVIALAIGIFCLAWYARTRKPLFLIAGLLLTLVVPGALLLCLLSVWIPSTIITYGPPPSLTP